MGFIKDKKKQISKSFTMYAVEGGGNGGTVMLKLVRPHCRSCRRHATSRCAALVLSSLLPRLPRAELHSEGRQRSHRRARG